jgi:hypothetical protein
LNDLPFRPERSDLRVPLTFKVNDVRVSGHSVNVSSSGILVRLDEPVELWIGGENSLEVGEWMIEIQARVARMQGRDVGLAFVIRNDHDRLAVQLILEYAGG